MATINISAGNTLELQWKSNRLHAYTSCCRMVSKKILGPTRPSLSYLNLCNKYEVEGKILFLTAELHIPQQFKEHLMSQSWRKNEYLIWKQYQLACFEDKHVYLWASNNLAPNQQRNDNQHHSLSLGKHIVISRTWNMRQLPINAHEHLNLTLRCLPVFGPLLEHTEHFRPICAVTGSRDIQCS